MQDRLLRVSLAMCLALVAGCGQSYRIVPVEGVVRLDGKPLPGVEVHFAPDVDVDLKSPPFSRGLTDEAGRYSLLCDRGQSGAAVGPHLVIVRYPFRYGEQSASASRPGRPVPRAYQSFATTPLRVEVVGDKSVYDLELTTK